MDFFIKTLWLRLQFFIRNCSDFLITAYKFYPKSPFRRADLALLKAYAAQNPYTLSRKFLEARGESEIYAYGETPLATLEKIADVCQITKEDRVFELGCGRGRTCFWLALILKAKVVGIDFVPEFISIADQVCQDYKIENLQFFCEDFLKSDLSAATVIYLHGSCMEDKDLIQLNEKLMKLRKDLKVITVSFPMSDFSPPNVWENIKTFRGHFSWGSADVYLQKLK